MLATTAGTDAISLHTCSSASGKPGEVLPSDVRACTPQGVTCHLNSRPRPRYAWQPHGGRPSPCRLRFGHPAGGAYRLRHRCVRHAARPRGVRLPRTDSERQRGSSEGHSDGPTPPHSLHPTRSEPLHLPAVRAADAITTAVKTRRAAATQYYKHGCYGRCSFHLMSPRSFRLRA